VRAYDRRPIFPPNCSYCGHKPHTEPCAGEIQTGAGKKPKTIPCPCRIGRETANA
jgi:hypothetical protein